MAGCSTTSARFDADWDQCADACLSAPLSVTASEALHRARREGDPWLARLIAAAQAGDDLAGRCVVQAVLGRLVAMARRDSRLGVDELVGALWLRIRSYPLERRPRAIVSNLVLDARKDAAAELRPLPVPPPANPRRHAVAANLLVEAVRLGVIDAPTAEVMSSVYVLGLSGEAAARRHGVTPTTVRWRCSAGMRRLAQARAQLV
jgi:DNA-directed RNA polymerase specialized sigma24 family protein